MLHLQGMWKQGSDRIVNLAVESLESKSYYDKYNRVDYDIIPASYGMNYTQASTFYNIYLQDNPINNRKFLSPEYDNAVFTAN